MITPIHPDSSNRIPVSEHGKIPHSEEINKLGSLFSKGLFAEAEISARAMTERYPMHSFGWKVLGAVLQHKGKNAEALLSKQKVAALSPADASAHFNLGNAYCALGKLEEAAASYQRTLKIMPNLSDAYFNLGYVFQNQGKPDDAAYNYRKAISLKPDYVAAYNDLGNLLRKQGKLDDAAFNYRQAISLKTDHPTAYCNLGLTLSMQGKTDEALACIQQQLRVAPENGMAQHLFAILSGKNAERAPNQYVESLFDTYAEKFDTHLQQVLKYQIPEELVALVMPHLALSAEKWDVLDLGCGTGLVGAVISPLAQRLVGVDLSSKMLEKAHARNIYHRLEHMDLLTMMRDEKDASYNIIVAADVFVYIGKLDEIFSEARRLICPGGIFAFSAEAIEVSNGEANPGTMQEYQLGNTGRYSHSINYITSLASAYGFQLLEVAETRVRIEDGKSVKGYLVLLKI